MIDIQLIRDNADAVQTNAKNKNVDVDISAILELDETRRHLKEQLDEIQRQRNIAAKEQDREKGGELKDEAARVQEELRPVEEELNTLLEKIPNIASDDTPIGATEDQNVTIKTWGEKPEFSFKPKEHWQLGADLGVIDTESAANISGARFAYLKGDLTLLQFALVQFVFQTLTDENKIKEIAKSADLEVSTKGFTPVVPPVMMRTEVMQRMARLEPREERYHVPSDDLYLIGSAEHTLGPLHMDEILDEADLPIRYIGYSSSFRREAGTYGKDTKGIIRVHQFDKLEMETLSHPEASRDEHGLLIAIQEYFVQSLKLPYQLSLKCTGDQGAPDARAVDIETWMPGQNKYRETHTADYMTDYQSRRLNTRVKIDKKKRFVHMNDATAIAIGRTIVAIMENYQEEDGRIRIPDVLLPFMMGKTHIDKIQLMNGLKTWVEIQESDLRSNVQNLRSLISNGAQFGGVVKADAYGHNLNIVTPVLIDEGVNVICVDSIDEAIAVRKISDDITIVILGYTLESRLFDVVSINAHQVVYSKDIINKLSEIASGLGKTAQVHIKIETGTLRQGIWPNQLEDLVEIMKSLPSIHIAGVSTHFANIEEEDSSFAQAQMGQFKRAVDLIYQAGLNPSYVHAACSAAVILYPATHFTLVRPGISTYGFWPSEPTERIARMTGRSIKLSPILTWKTKVAQIKDAPMGSTIGYGRTEILRRRSKIAVLPIGYWDGYDRKLSSIGEVLIRGQRCKVLGRVCMNMIMVDVTEVPQVTIEDDVILIGREGKNIVSAKEMADKLQTIHYEITTRINPKIKRILV